MNEPTGISVLYVDDEEILLQAGSRYITHRYPEISVETVPSAREALEMLAKTDYDAIISDYQMPETNGIEFLKILREAGNDIPFVIFTGRGREEVVIEAINSGVDFYLQKGRDPKSQYAELIHKVRSAVRRHRTEQALIESEQRLALAMEATKDGIWDWNFQTGHAYFSPRYYSMLGYEPEEFPASFEAWKDLIHPDDRDYAEQMILAHVMGSTETFEVEFRMRKQDGTYLWVLGRGKVVAQEEDGRPLLLAGTHTDISERKAAEEDQKISWYAIESTIIGIALLGLDSKLTYANPAARDILGFSPDEDVEGISIFDFAKDKPGAYAIRDILRTKGRWQGELEALHGQKDTINVLVSESLVKNDEGVPLCIILSFLDVTKAKKAEKALLERKEELERFERIVVGRELKMVELKEKIKELEGRIPVLEEKR